MKITQSSNDACVSSYYMSLLEKKNNYGNYSRVKCLSREYMICVNIFLKEENYHRK